MCMFYYSECITVPAALVISQIPGTPFLPASQTNPEWQHVDLSLSKRYFKAKCAPSGPAAKLGAAGQSVLFRRAHAGNSVVLFPICWQKQAVTPELLRKTHLDSDGVKGPSQCSSGTSAPDFTTWGKQLFSTWGTSLPGLVERFSRNMDLGKIHGFDGSQPDRGTHRKQHFLNSWGRENLHTSMSLP